jgi:hypothetical protein
LPAIAGQHVSVELVLAVDVSLSINDVEYRLQMSGIANALRDKEVQALINGQRHGVAIAMTQWSGTYRSNQPLPWRFLSDSASINALAAVIEETPRNRLGSLTGIGHAINFATRMIEENDFDGDELKIDVSGDGRNNSGPEPSWARLMAANRGIAINGLAISRDDRGLTGYYERNVIVGPGAFVIEAKDFGDFAYAFKQKLKRELSPKISRRMDTQWTARADQ